MGKVIKKRWDLTKIWQEHVRAVFSGPSNELEFELRPGRDMKHEFTAKIVTRAHRKTHYLKVAGISWNSRDLKNWHVTSCLAKQQR